MRRSWAYRSAQVLKLDPEDVVVTSIPEVVNDKGAPDVGEVEFMVIFEVKGIEAHG